ncbi:hypothetical protein NUW58_g9793 [Xylaria curta]|uniref:Uncharacterized protein n=1 Tax=Xylaria curta TaxID=42375 RepID=A0ACC1MUD5_9PEZI|nr:hypothetical protein NUW58_g9793 [Xylaria curta]
MSNTQASDNVPEPKEVLTDYDTNNNNSMEAVGYYNQGKLYPQTLDGTTYVPGVTLLNGGTIRQSLQGQPLPLASVPNQYTQANGQVIDESDVHPALRSQIPNSYFSQSEFTHGPPNAYNPVPRQAYRASQVSSLSSGFGDGDIIMPPPNVMAKPPVSQATDTNINIRPFSWMSRTTGLDRKRDTVSTMKSEGPPRFLPVDSWVDQQKERTERAGSREEVPMVPAQFVVMQQTGYS